MEIPVTLQIDDKLVELFSTMVFPFEIKDPYYECLEEAILLDEDPELFRERNPYDYNKVLQLVELNLLKSNPYIPTELGEQVLSWIKS